MSKMESTGVVDNEALATVESSSLSRGALDLEEGRGEVIGISLLMNPPRRSPPPPRGVPLIVLSVFLLLLLRPVLSASFCFS